MHNIIMDKSNEKQVDNLYEKLVNLVLSYHPSTNIKQIEKSYIIARQYHMNQYRKSGEPFIIHPLAVAIILAELKLDKETIIAGLLHDLVEDTSITNREIKSLFGNEVSFIVEGLTKLKKIPGFDEKEEIQAENYRKLFIAMAQDIRVILIKLADRLHNIRTLEFQPHRKQVEIAQETLDIYAPIAQRLGVFVLKSELEDLSLKYLKEELYYDITLLLENLTIEKEEVFEEIIHLAKEKLDQFKIDVIIDYRIKHIFSIYKKIVKKHQKIDDLYEFFYIRIIADNIQDCYTVLGHLHNLFHPLPGRFKDYIAMPKNNHYQSIHTTFINSRSQLFEVQIRTAEMDHVAEYGITHGWKYREKADTSTNEGENEKLVWLKEILDWQLEIEDNKEFLNLIKNEFDLMTENIYCFTPSGESKYFKKGVTIIDFAYSIHGNLGNSMTGTLVNGISMPFNYILRNGDIIEILTSSEFSGPTEQWLRDSITPKARNSINKWLREKYCDITKIEDESYCSPNTNQLSLKFKLAKCCCPVYGDDIICYREKDLVKIHRLNCPESVRMTGKKDSQRVDISWNRELFFMKNKDFIARLKLTVNNKIGVLAEITQLISSLNINIEAIKILNNKSKRTIITIRFNVNTVSQIEYLTVELGNLEEIISIKRV